MKKILLIIVFIVSLLIGYNSTYAITAKQAIAVAKGKAASRPGAVVHAYNPATGEVSWGCTNGAKRGRIPVTPTKPGEPEAPEEDFDIEGGACAQYLSGWNDAWSDCDVIGKWNPKTSEIKCKQTHSWVPEYSGCGVLKEHYTAEGVLESTSCDASSCPPDEPVPSPVSDNIATLSMGATTTYFDENTYADNKSTNDIQIEINSEDIEGGANVIWGDAGEIKKIDAFGGEVSLDRVSKTGSSALNFTQLKKELLIEGWGSEWVINMTGITSYAPLFTNSGTITFEAGGVPMKRENVVYYFQKPFTGKIEIFDFKKQQWSGSGIQIGTNQKYRLVGQNNKSINITNYKIDDFTDKILAYDEENHFIPTKSVSGTTLQYQSGAIFYATMNTATGATKLGSPGIKIETPVISYTFEGKKVRYYLNDSIDGDNEDALINEDAQEFLGVRVIGGIQGAGKSEFTGQKANISNLYNSQMRTEIRKNAYNYVKNMTSGQILNGVKYVKGDITLSGNLTYETLVVVDGNVIINDNLNIDNKVLGIIVLKDNYDVNKDYEKAGNIYVTPNVTQINAMIYSDGALISADNTTKKPYLKDTIERTESLQKQLFMNGSLFTRNTIGGAILAGGNYILPGGVKMAENSSNFEKAMLYDLNYVRRGSDGCDKSTPSNDNCNDNGEYKDPFIIKYDSRIQTKPPKLFSY